MYIYMKIYVNTYIYIFYIYIIASHPYILASFVVDVIYIQARQHIYTSSEPIESFNRQI